jgi:hypothetical protein
VADLKISQLPGLATPTAADLFVTVSGGTTSQVTRAQLHELETGEVLNLTDGAASTLIQQIGANLYTTATGGSRWFIEGFNNGIQVTDPFQIRNGNILSVYNGDNTSGMTFRNNVLGATGTGVGATFEFRDWAFWDFIGAPTVRIRDGGALNVYDALDSEYVTMYHDGSNAVFDVLGGGSYYHRVGGVLKVLLGSSFTYFYNSLLVNDGSYIRISDSTNADYAQFRHDGTDFETIFTNTTAWNVLGANSLNVGSNAVGTTSVRIGNETLQGGNHTSHLRLWAEQSGVLYDAMLSLSAGSLSLQGLGEGGRTGASNFYLSSLNVLQNGGTYYRHYDATNLAYANHVHNGTDYVTTFVNTQDWRISGLTSTMAFDVPVFSLETATQFRLYDGANTKYMRVDNFGTYINFQHVGTTDWFIDDLSTLSLRDAAEFRIYDAGNTNYVEMDLVTPTVFNTTFTNVASAVWSGLSAEYQFIGGDFRIIGPQDGSLTTLYIGDTTVYANNSADGRLVMYGEHSSIKYGFQISVASGNVSMSGTTEGGVTAAATLQIPMNIQQTSGASHTFLDPTNADTAAFSHDGTDFNTTFSGTTDWNIGNPVSLSFATNGLKFFSNTASLAHNGTDWVFTNATGSTVFNIGASGALSVRQGADIDLRDGGSLFIRDGGDTDYAEFSHDGNNFLTDFTNTGRWQITGARMVLDNAAAADQGLLSLTAGDGGTGTLNFWQMLFGFSDTEQYRHGIRTRHNSGATTNNAIDFYCHDGAVDLQNDLPSAQPFTIAADGVWAKGVPFEITNDSLVIAQGPDQAEFSHDGTDFNTTFTTTTDWNISAGLTGAVVIDTQANTLSHLILGGTTPRGTSNDSRITMYGEAGSSAVYGVKFEVNSSWLAISAPEVGTSVNSIQSTIDFLATAGADVIVRDGGALRAQSPDDTRSMYLQLADNGIATWTGLSVVNLVFSNISGSIDINGGTALRFKDATNVDEVNMSHDGTDFLILPSVNTQDLMLGDEVGSASQWATVKIPGGGSFRVYDTSPSTHGVILGTNTNNGSDFGTIGPLGLGGIVINDNWFFSTGGNQDRFVFSRTNKPNGTFKEQSMEFRTDNTSIGWDYIWRTGSTSTQIIEQDIVQQDAIGTGTVQWKILDNGLNRVVVDFSSTLTRDLLDLYGGMGLRIRNSLNGDYAEMYHDGTDFNTDFTNTADWNITGLTGNVNLPNGSRLALFDSTGADKLEIYHNGADTYWNATNATTLWYFGLNQVNYYSGCSINSYSPDNSRTARISISDSGTLTFQGTGTGGTNVQFTNFNNSGSGIVDLKEGLALRVRDATDTDWVEMAHNGTAFNVTGTNTTQLNVLNIGEIQYNRQANGGTTLQVGESTTARGGSQFGQIELFGELVGVNYGAAISGQAGTLNILGAGANPMSDVIVDDMQLTVHDGNTGSLLGDARVEIADYGGVLGGPNKLLSLNSRLGVTGGQTNPFYGLHVDITPNNDAANAWGVYSKVTSAVTDAVYGVWGETTQGSSTFDSIGVLGHSITNSASTNHRANRALGTGPAVGVYAKATTTGATNTAQVTALYATNESVFAGESYGVWINTVAGPTNIYPFRIDHAGETILDMLVSSKDFRLRDGWRLQLWDASDTKNAELWHNGTDLQLGFTGGGSFLLPSVNDEANPTLAFGDGDTGFFEVFDDGLAVSLGGTYRWLWSGDSFQANNTNGPQLLNETASTNNPTLIPNRNDSATGIGSSGNTHVNIIASAVEAVRYSAASGSVLQTMESNVGLTADVSSVQGGGVITSTYNVYSTVGTGGDCATLPSSFNVGTIIYVKNDGANSMDVFPASGDNAGAGVDVAVAVAAGDFAVFLGTIAGSQLGLRLPVVLHKTFGC